MGIKIDIRLNGVDEDRIRQICLELGIEGKGLQLYSSSDGCLRVRGENGRYTIESPKEHLFYRGLVLLSRKLKKKKTHFLVQETPTYSNLGFMADASRNAVPTVEACKQMIHYLALMGYSSFQLYMEDTYELQEEPYFGYFRGAYSVAELQEIEAEARNYGMEFIPCIQTLAHLSAYFKWNIQEVQQRRDIDDILLIGCEKTYELIDKMFASLSQLQTRKMNIGMDEAYQVGLGQFLNIHGPQDRSLIMCQHLERVLDIADKYQFQCSMWSDMFFKLMAKTKDFSGQLDMNQNVFEYMERLKRRVTLIYWDYYQTDETAYDQNFSNHQQLGADLAFAGGAWKWIGYTPDNQFSLDIAPKAYRVSQKYQVKDVTVTGWGDNGGECSTFSVLPTLQAWAELTYTGSYGQLSDHFEEIVGMTLDDFLKMDSANFTPSNHRNSSGLNPARYMLYQDILCPLLQNHIDVERDVPYLREVATLLKDIADKKQSLSYLFKTQCQLCQLLADKIEITDQIRAAYHQKNKKQLEKLSLSLNILAKQLSIFHETYSQQWLKENKVFGLDTIDIRLGGLNARINRAVNRLGMYLNGEIDRVDELEVAILPYNDYFTDSDGKATTANQWHLIATASTIYTT